MFYILFLLVAIALSVILIKKYPNKKLLVIGSVAGGLFLLLILFVIITVVVVRVNNPSSSSSSENKTPMNNTKSSSSNSAHSRNNSVSSNNNTVSSSKDDYGNVEEIINIITQNPLRVEQYSEFTVRGIMENMQLIGSEVYITLRRPNISVNKFFVIFKLNNFPSELYNIVPGDIITLKGYYEEGSFSWKLTSCSLINIEKKYHLIKRDIYTGRQFFNLLHSNFVWASGKTFNVKVKISSIMEIQGNIVLRIEGMQPSDYLMIYDFPFIFDNSWKSQILKLNVGDIVTIRGVFVLKSFFGGYNSMGLEQCEIVN